MEDGSLGYFYSPSQLEYIRDQFIRTAPLDVLFRDLNINPINNHRDHHLEPQFTEPKRGHHGANS